MNIGFEDYLMRFEGEKQRRLSEILNFFTLEFPDTVRLVWHACATFFADYENRRDIVNVGGYKDHISIYLPFDMIDKLKQNYPQFIYTKGTICFPDREPLPHDMLPIISELIRHNYLLQKA